MSVASAPVPVQNKDQIARETCKIISETNGRETTTTRAFGTGDGSLITKAETERALELERHRDGVFLPSQEVV